jgi:hypothetical protein
MTLIERIRYRLRMLRLGLTLKPIAGADGEGGGEPSGGGEPAGKGGEPEPKGGQEPEKKEEKPPWGSDDEFDPKRAWKLIQDVRSDAEKAKTERDKLREDQKSREDAEKSDQQKLEERATGAEKDAGEAKAEAARLKVALRKGLTETQAKRLVGQTEEDLEKDADELLESFKSESGGEEPSRRPKERLRPGAAPSAEPEESDPAKLAGQVPRY